MKTRNNNKQGISLIVLVITIIVMIILAAAIILSLSSNGIIDRANEAVTKTDIGQVQTLASTIWAESYLDKREGKIQDIEEVVRKRLEKELGIEEGKLDDYYEVEFLENGVIIDKIDTMWIDLGEERIAQYTEEGFVMELISEITLNATYRLEIQSPLYEGYVKINPFIYDEGIGWGFFINENGKVKSINSLDEFESIGEEFVTGTLKCEIWGGTNTGIMIMSSEANATQTYKITKTEIGVPINSKKIYDGELILNTFEEYEMPGLNIENKYMVVAERIINDGDNETRQTIVASTLGGFYWGEPCIVLLFGGQFLGEDGLFVYDNSLQAMFQEENTVIKQIYDLGKSGDVIRENGFVISTFDLTGEKNVTLIGVPGGEYVIPKSVGGMEITEIIFDSLAGKVTIENNVKLSLGDKNLGLEVLIIKKEAEEIIKNFVGNTYVLSILDVTDCGDDVDIPEELLDDTDFTIHVTSNAKEKHYKNNTNVIGV